MKTPKNIIRPAGTTAEPPISLAAAASMLEQRVIEAHRSLDELQARLRPVLFAEAAAGGPVWGSGPETTPVGVSPLASSLASVGECLSRLNARIAFLIDSVDLDLPAVDEFAAAAAADLGAVRRVVG